MVPAGDPTEQTVNALADLMDEGDTIVDGGNTNWHDDVRRAAALHERGIHYVDVGTSGGVWGLEVGYCMMVGGHEESVQRLAPILDVLAPPDGWRRFGDAGAGHFVKMVHNGVEYGIMQAYGEGFELMYKSKFDIDLKEVAGLWNRGSVVRSWLCELAERAFEQEGNDLADIGASASRTPARAAGRSSTASTSTSRPRSSPPRCTRASTRAARASTRTRCSPRCATSSAATRSSGRQGGGSMARVHQTRLPPGGTRHREPAGRGARAASRSRRPRW